MPRVLVLLVILCAVSARAAFFPSPADWRDVPIYMIFTDRFADADVANNELTPGAKPDYANPRGIHGGDFKGIEEHLDYIHALGSRGIWITPVFLNDPGSAWHGYGALDFQRISPQLGGAEGLRSLVAAAHRRGLRVILDVVLNHLGSIATSDDPGWPNYRKLGEGYKLRWISPALTPPPPFNRLDWLHDRGQVGDWFDPVESVVGQFFSLVDLKTELPEVRAALLKAYQDLIRETDCDGFRVDTVRHVEQSFWAPWCTGIREYAATLGKTNFFLFGEIALRGDADVGKFTGPSGAAVRAYDSLLDYPLYYLIESVVISNAPTRLLTERFERLAPPLYSRESMDQMVTFVDNHDQPRFLSMEKARWDAARLRQALVLIHTARGVPCVYYGTEQGFRGGGDPHNREDMIERSAGRFGADHFDTNNVPLFPLIARLNSVRAAHPALRRGSQRVLVDEESGPGLFAFSRFDGRDSALVILNTAEEPKMFSVNSSPWPAGTELVPQLRKLKPILVGPGGAIGPRKLALREAEIWVAR